LRLSWNSRPAMEGFPNRSINFKDAYRILSVHVTSTMSDRDLHKKR